MVGLVVFAAGASAQVSFDFDAGLEGWTGGARVSWSEVDGRFQVLSGSMLVRSDAASICVPVTSPFLHHVFEARVLLPEPHTSNLAAISELSFYGLPNCAGGAVAYLDAISGREALARWQPLKVDTRDIDDQVLNVIHPSTQSAQLRLVALSGAAYFDEVRFGGYLALQGGTFGCTPDTYTACLGANRRFQVRVFWQTASDSGPGRLIEQGQDSATVWFFNKNNTELLVKVLDGCGVNGHFWAFVAGLTNVLVNVQVLDTFTAQLVQYSSPQGTVFSPQLDTEAFATCP